MSGNQRSLAPRSTAALVVALSMALAAGAEAAPTASGKAWDISAQINILGLPALDLGVQNQVAFASSEAPFADQKSVLGFDSGANALARLSTGEINVETEWVPGPSFLAVGSQASIADAALEAVSVLGGAPLLALDADLIRATAIVSGTCPAETDRPVARPAALVDGYIFANGFETENLDTGGGVETPGLGVGGSILDDPLLDLPVNPEPNTSLGVPGVLTLILNERTVSGDGITQRGVVTNGVHLTVNVVNLISADVILAHAEAAIDCGGN